LPPETRKERAEAWREALRFAGMVVLEILAMGW
jgi:hypothetical protein